MALDSLNRFQKRRKMKNSTTIYKDVDEQLVSELLNSEVNQAKVDDIYISLEEHYDMAVSEEEAQAFLVQFKKDFNDERFNKLIHDCKKEVINSIVTPFGLGKVVATYDKVGGNVTTIHNANQKIYAVKEDEYNRKDYERTKNSNGKQFAGQGKNSVGSNYTKSQMDDNGNVQDAYTGKIQKADTTSPDHIESLSQYHKDGGFMQSKTQKADFATDEDNLALTDRSINQSMRDFDKKEWAKKETQKGNNNKERFGIDEKKFQEQLEKGKKTKENHLPTSFEKSTYYAKNISKTGATEGAKMGMQQALGLVITEFFAAVFDEIFDIYKNGFTNGFDNKQFFNVLKERLTTIATKVKNKWKDAAVAFKDGFISGFISNLATTVINMFVTTGKRVVRIIREGLFSLFRAIKLLIFPPADMSYEDAMHEAKKLIATGLIVSMGVIAEEWVDALIKGTTILEPFADILTAVFVGAITGLSITMVVYHIDKKRNNKEMFNSLVNDTNTKFDKLDDLLSSLSYESVSPALVLSSDI